MAGRLWTYVVGPDYEVGGWAHFDVTYIGELSQLPDRDDLHSPEFSSRYNSGDIDAAIAWHKPRKGRIAIFSIFVGWNPRDTEIFKAALGGLDIALGGYTDLSNQEVRETEPSRCFEQRGWTRKCMEVSREFGLPIAIVYSRTQLTWVAEYTRLIAQLGVAVMLIERESVLERLPQS